MPKTPIDPVNFQLTNVGSPPTIKVGFAPPPTSVATRQYLRGKQQDPNVFTNGFERRTNG